MPTLIVEDGTGLSTANTYVSEADADTYFTNKGVPAEWLAATSTKKQEALIAGTQWLDAHYRKQWLGVRSLQTQRLQWPRTNVFDGSGYQISGIPRDLKEATIEAALRSLKGEIGIDEIGAIASETKTVGEISTSKSYVGGKSSSKSFPIIRKLLYDLITGISLDRS